MARKTKRQRDAEQLLHFIELRVFTKQWDEFGFPDDELGNLQITIMLGPKDYPVIRGTHGVRKMRYPPASWNTGKSGALRVCYVYFEALHVVLLGLVYSKTEQEDLPEPAKKRINNAVDRVESQLWERSQGDGA